MGFEPSTSRMFNELGCQFYVTDKAWLGKVSLIVHSPCQGGVKQAFTGYNLQEYKESSTVEENGIDLPTAGTDLWRLNGHLTILLSLAVSDQALK